MRGLGGRGLSCLAVSCAASFFVMCGGSVREENAAPSSAGSSGSSSASSGAGAGGGAGAAGARTVSTGGAQGSSGAPSAFGGTGAFGAGGNANADGGGAIGPSCASFHCCDEDTAASSTPTCDPQLGLQCPSGLDLTPTYTPCPVLPPYCRHKSVNDLQGTPCTPGEECDFGYGKGFASCFCSAGQTTWSCGGPV